MYIEQLKNFFKKYYKKRNIYIFAFLLFSLFTIHSYFKEREKEASELFCHAQRIYWEGRVEDAKPLFERIEKKLSGTSSYKFALLYLAKIYLDEGRREEAKKIYKKAVSACRKHKELLFFVKERLARLLMDEGNYESALSIYKTLLDEAHPESRTPYLLFCIARCLEHLNKEEAMSYYSSIIKNHKESEYARYAAIFLSELKKKK